MDTSRIDLILQQLEPRYSDQPSKRKLERSKPSSPLLLSKEKVPSKSIDCFGCGNNFPTPINAFSTQCPQCGLHMFLDDIYLSPNTKKTLIHTHGNVYIHKDARLKKLTLYCKNLYLNGQASGNFYCKNDLFIRSSCTIDGKIKAQTLHIAKRKKVNFRTAAEVTHAIIEGELIGNIIAKENVILKPGAVIMGDIQASHIEIPLEATHHGLYKPYNPYTS